MSAYTSVNVETCRALNHRLVIAGSDKTPMKKNLICETCSNSGRTAYAAYGVDTLSFGEWQAGRKGKTNDEL